jgi:predicted aldo/keto reductase-like oxidoreductase
MIVSMKSKAAIDLFVGGSGWSPPSRTEIGLLKTYVEQNDATYCRTGCNTCESSCPKGVAISDVLRARMYAEDYGEPEIARSTYAALGSATAAACLTCDDTPCLGACPFGLEVSRLTKSTPAIVGSS